jgi:vitamin B12 transporter
MDDYTTCDLLLDYRLNQDTRFFARATNLFDEDYQEVFRYKTEGRGFYFGVSRTW